MARAVDVPKFGPLQGVRVINAAKSTAGGFCSSVLAEMGADVIWCESPQSLDPTRAGAGEPAQAEHRNMRNICFSTPTPEGREILFDLLKNADIFFESSKGDHYAHKWGMTDEFLWSINPKLIIVHMTGFGVEGDPAYIRRPSFDGTAQAYSGFLTMQGQPGEIPFPAQPQIADYYFALFSASSAMAAYYRAKRTGEGESVDVAQIDCLMRVVGRRPMDLYNNSINDVKEGSKVVNCSGWGVYKCMDGKYVYMLHLGPSAIKAGLEIVGLGDKWGTDEYPVWKGNGFTAEPAGAELERRIVEFCNTHTAKEVEDTYWPAGVPCCRVMDYKDLAAHPHVQARGSVIEWEGVDGMVRKGAAPTPRFKNDPTKIWRGCPGVGYDNEDILKDLGYSDDKIKELYDKKVIMKLPIGKWTKEMFLAAGYTEDMFES